MRLSRAMAISNRTAPRSDDSVVAFSEIRQSIAPLALTNSRKRKNQENPRKTCEFLRNSLEFIRNSLEIIRNSLEFLKIRLLIAFKASYLLIFDLTKASKQRFRINTFKSAISDRTAPRSDASGLAPPAATTKGPPNV